MTEQRTLPISCPRCGAEVPARVYRADVRVRVHDANSYAGSHELMHGLEADVTLMIEHSC